MRQVQGKSRRGWGGVVGGFEAGVEANTRIGVSRYAVDVDAGPAAGRLQSIGRAAVARPAGPGFFASLGGAIANAFRLIIPVLALLTVGAAAFVYASAPAPFLAELSGTDHWLTLGLALVPATFFVIQLTARRYGFGYAFGQIVGAWAAFLAITTLANAKLAMPIGAISYTRPAVAFAIALFFAQVLAALVFHGLRGPRWWVAPLMSTIIAGMFFSIAGFAAAYAGMEGAWVGHMGAYVVFIAGSAIALLIPYWVMRPILPPLPGFGGY